MGKRNEMQGIGRIANKRLACFGDELFPVEKIGFRLQLRVVDRNTPAGLDGDLRNAQLPAFAQEAVTRF